MVATRRKRHGGRQSSSNPAPRLIFTDASVHGWGAHMEDRMAHGVWTDEERQLHINILEMKAVDLALRRFKDLVAYSQVLISTDNATVRAYLKIQGGRDPTVYQD